MVHEKTITENGDSKFISLGNGEWVIEAVCSDWGDATATLKRILGNESYTVQDSSGDVVFDNNGGTIVAGGGCYLLNIADYNNSPITFKASPF